MLAQRSQPMGSLPRLLDHSSGQGPEQRQGRAISSDNSRKPQTSRVTSPPPPWITPTPAETWPRKDIAPPEAAGRTNPEPMLRREGQQHKIARRELDLRPIPQRQPAPALSDQMERRSHAESAPAAGPSSQRAGLITPNGARKLLFRKTEPVRRVAWSSSESTSGASAMGSRCRVHGDFEGGPSRGMGWATLVERSS